MKATVYLTDGQLDFADLDDDTALDLKQGLSTEQFLTFDMDGTTVLVNAAHIVRIDLETSTP